MAGGCPFQAGTSGFVSFPEAIADDKVCGKPEKFAEHYAQATLFYNSQAEVEKAHIAAAFRFELSKVGVPAIRKRMVSSLLNVSEELAAEVAAGSAGRTRYTHASDCRVGRGRRPPTFARRPSSFIPRQRSSLDLTPSDGAAHLCGQLH